jgi:hypothetical protein
MPEIVADQRVALVLGAGPDPREQLDLEVVERVDPRVAVREPLEQRRRLA